MLSSVMRFSSRPLFGSQSFPAKGMGLPIEKARAEETAPAPAHHPLKRLKSSASAKPPQKLPWFHSVGRRHPQAADLRPYQDWADAFVKTQTATWNNKKEISMNTGARLFFNQDTLQQLPGRHQYFLKTILDTDGNHRISRQELMTLGYRLDRMGDKDGTVSLQELRNGMGLVYRHYLLDQARQMGMTPLLLFKLEKLLASQAYSVSRDSEGTAWDLSKSCRSSGIQFRKARQAASNLDDVKQHFPLVRAQQKIQKEMLSLFASTQNMPHFQTDPNGFSLYQTFLSETFEDLRGVTRYKTEVYKTNFSAQEPGSQDWSRQCVSKRLLSIRRNESFASRTFPSFPMIEHRKQVLLQALKAYEKEGGLARLTEALTRPNRLTTANLTRITRPLYQVLHQAFGFDSEVPVHWRQEAHCSDLQGARGAYLQKPYRMVLLNADHFQACFASLVKDAQIHGLSKTMAVQWLVKELVRVMSHELSHAEQEEQVEKARFGELDDSALSDTERIQARRTLFDYRINMEHYNDGLDVETVFGDRDAYFNQPVESDANLIADAAGAAVYPELPLLDTSVYSIEL